MTIENTTRLTDEEAAAEARRIIGAFATSYRDDTPLPVVGDAPPVAQPGRPPMSQRATDVSGVMLAAGVASLPIGGSVSLVLYTLGQVDPTQLAIGAAAPVALVLAVGGLMRKLAGVRTEHHHHYDGANVTQDYRETHNSAKGVVARVNHRQK